jgi:protein-S-isoprenylcysteine O-methyltransferase Ste14
MTLQAIKNYLIKNRAVLINWYLFLNIIGFCLWQGYAIYQKGALHFNEISFILQNLVLAAVVLIRKDHIAIDRNIKNQLIAVIAFFSGMAFMGQPASSNHQLVLVSDSVIFCANILGLVTLLNLGKSFGILIALRKVKTRGLYGLVRHPMYATDILLRIGFLVSHLNPFTGLVFVLSTACYVYRAVLEERFLSQDPAYREYMQKVRCRFIPFVF